MPAPQVRNQQDRQAYEAAWRDSLAQEPSAFRRQHGVGIRVRRSAGLWSISCSSSASYTAGSQDLAWWTLCCLTQSSLHDTLSQLVTHMQMSRRGYLCRWTGMTSRAGRGLGAAETLARALTRARPGGVPRCFL